MEREEISQIMYHELDNQPAASERVREAYNALNDAFEEYINAMQEDAFCFGYITAMKK